MIHSQMGDELPANLPIKIISYSSVASENKPPKSFNHIFPCFPYYSNFVIILSSFSPIEKENCHHTAVQVSKRPGRRQLGRVEAWRQVVWRKRGWEIHEEIWEKPRKTPGKPWEIHYEWKFSWENHRKKWGNVLASLVWLPKGPLAMP